MLSVLLACLALVQLCFASPSLKKRDAAANSKILPHYTALGDSYATGVGPFTFLDADPDPNCLRTKSSYPYQLLLEHGDDLRISTINFPACSGATTTDLVAQIESGTGDRPLPTPSYEFGSPDLVSISAGGNDGHMFSDLIRACVLSLFTYKSDSYEYYNPCTSEWYQAVVDIYSVGRTVGDIYKQALTANLSDGQTREVYVLGYARFYNINGGREHCPNDDKLPTPPLEIIAGNYLNDLVDLLNTNIREAAQDVGATFVDINAKFEGHRICDKECWFQTDYPAGEHIFHPTDQGNKAIMEAFWEAIA